jgi:hypothetical protein
MTVVAWDGKTLAADKMAVVGGGAAAPVCKIWESMPGSGDRCLMAVSGAHNVALELVHWFSGGADPEKFPGSAREGDATLITIRRDADDEAVIETYCAGPYPMRTRTEQWAWGSGRDFALAAMHLGKNAVEAVEVACQFQSDCGIGIDHAEL